MYQWGPKKMLQLQVLQHRIKKGLSILEQTPQEVRLLRRVVHQVVAHQVCQVTGWMLVRQMSMSTRSSTWKGFISPSCRQMRHHVVNGGQHFWLQLAALIWRREMFLSSFRFTAWIPDAAEDSVRCFKHQMTLWCSTSTLLRSSLSLRFFLPTLIWHMSWLRGLKRVLPGKRGPRVWLLWTSSLDTMRLERTIQLLWIRCTYLVWIWKAKPRRIWRSLWRRPTTFFMGSSLQTGLLRRLCIVGFGTRSRGYLCWAEWLIRWNPAQGTQGRDLLSGFGRKLQRRSVNGGMTLTMRMFPRVSSLLHPISLHSLPQKRSLHPTQVEKGTSLQSLQSLQRIPQLLLERYRMIRQELKTEKRPRVHFTLLVTVGSVSDAEICTLVNLVLRQQGRPFQNINRQRVAKEIKERARRRVTRRVERDPSPTYPLQQLLLRLHRRWPSLRLRAARSWVLGKVFAHFAERLFQVWICFSSSAFPSSQLLFHRS